MCQNYGDFKAQLGKRDHEGFLPHDERLQKIQPNQNPYVVGSALPGNSPVFYGRAQILHEILGVFRGPSKPGCISLLGERRIGKSSLLNQVYQALPTEEGVITVFGNAQNWCRISQENFFTGLYRAIHDVLPDSPQQSVNDYGTFRDFIVDQAGVWRFVLIIDEFEEMTGNKNFDTLFFSNLRTLGYQPEYAFGYLLASRRPLEELCKQQDIASSAFWNIFGFPHVLGLLKADEAESLVQEPLQRSLNGTLRNTDKLWYWTGFHPAMIQMVMLTYWLSHSGGYSMNKPQVRQGLRAYYHDLWCRRSREEWAVLLRLADGKQVKSDAILEELQQRGLVSEGRLFSDLFAECIPGWLPKGKNVKEVLEQIEEGTEQANKLFSQVEKLANTAGKLRKQFLNPDDDSGDEDS